MKILFISDIHGITTNLNHIEKVFNDKRCDKLVVLGDLYRCFDFDNPNYDKIKVQQFLESFKEKIICVQGNNDTVLDIKISNFPIIYPLGLIYTDSIEIYITHGHQFNMRENTKIKTGVLIYGHEHIPYIYKDQNIVYINTGSISCPRASNPPTYTIYENKKFTIYDIDDQIVDSIFL